MSRNLQEFKEMLKAATIPELCAMEKDDNYYYYDEERHLLVVAEAFSRLRRYFNVDAPIASDS